MASTLSLTLATALSSRVHSVSAYKNLTLRSGEGAGIKHTDFIEIPVGGSLESLDTASDGADDSLVLSSLQGTGGPEGEGSEEEEAGELHVGR